MMRRSVWKEDGDLVEEEAEPGEDGKTAVDMRGDETLMRRRKELQERDGERETSAPSKFQQVRLKSPQLGLVHQDWSREPMTLKWSLGFLELQSLKRIRTL